MRIPTSLRHTRLSLRDSGDPDRARTSSVLCTATQQRKKCLKTLIVHLTQHSTASHEQDQSSLGQRDAAAPAVNNALNLARRLPIVGMMSTAYRQSVGHNRISALHSQQSPKWTNRLTSSATALLKHKAATGLRLPENFLCQQQADLINLVTHFTASC